VLHVPSKAGSAPVLDSLPPGGTVAFDLSGTVGWCYAPDWMAVPASGQWELPHWGGKGAKGAAFLNLLEPFMDRYQPTHMVLERVLPLPAMNNWSVAYQQFGLGWMAWAEAYRASCAVTEIDALTVRSDIMGQRRFSKDTVKREVVAYCRRRGIKVTSHHAADAVLCWLWHRARLQGEAPVAGPLFREVAA
jgi:hypothetical protein